MKRCIFSFLVVVLSFVTMGCVDQASFLGTEYLYADGNGNSYRVTETLLEYDPVSPLESSSGVYDGGEPKSTPLDAGQFAELQKLLADAMGDTAEHAEFRQMRTGYIRIDSDPQKPSVILKADSEWIPKIEEKLAQFL